MQSKIQEALLKLDINNDEHWTGDGLPKVSSLDIEGLTRAKITDAAPHFTRENPKIEKEKDNADEKGIQQEKSSEEDSEEKVQEQEEVNFTLDQLKEKAAAEIEKAEADLAAAKKYLSKAQLEYDNIVNEIEKTQKGTTTQDDIMAFIKSQNRLREQRVAQQKAIFPHGFPSNFGPAPIDQRKK